jgi:8-oxo-dGTP pyrophosphatase MutT (NUDIX family)
MVAVEAIRRALAGHVPATLELGSMKAAAVLVPLLFKDGVPHLLFTRRTEHLSTHRGQISFPGGGRHDEDRDLIATALRETWEELGIPPETVRIIGPLDDVWSLHGYCVTPIAAEIPPPPMPRVNAYEVAEVIEVDVVRLLDEKIHRRSRLRWLGHLFDVHYYDYGRHTIWGMTGVIVHRLLSWLRGEESEAPPSGS